jgi:hypothetical protein
LQHPGKSVLTLALTVLATPLSAHHGIGRFDPAREITVEGTLTTLDFVNPHSYVHFNAVDANGAAIAMQCEMRAATVLRRSGWSPEMFVPGVAIKIHGRPHRDDPHYCYADTLTIGDAPTLERYQQLSGSAPASRAADRPFRLASGKPNLAGDWAQEQYIMARPPQGPANLVPESLVKAVEAGDVAMADVPSHGWFPPPVTLTAAGQTASAALRDLPPERNPRLSCQITSVLFDWVFDGTINRITQSDDVIKMEYGRGLERTVYMNAAHPSGVAPSRAGHSIGRWDGDTLVVDTVGFEPGGLAGAIAHSAELHVVERFTLDPATLALRRDYVATDPLHFVNEYVSGDTVLPADAPFAVDACEELAFEYQPGGGGARP